MKKGAQIRKHILEFLADGKEHTTCEIKEYILSKNIKLEKSSTLIRNVLYNLKHENPSLVNVGRGKYKLLIQDNCMENNSELENAIYIIEKNLDEYKNFNWITCDDLQLNIARSRTQMLIKLANTIQTEMTIQL